MSDLIERVLSVVDQIPPGKVLTYGDVAELASAPTPRHVGQVLLHHGNEVPWWRVLRVDGTPAPHLRERQLQRLREEGAPILPNGDAVDLRRCRWHPDGDGEDPTPSLFD
jgi:methylated-DNA-protein-cysteine methyltransferase-like protein